MVDIARQCVIWSYPTASGTAELVYNFAENNWTQGLYNVALLYQGINGNAFEAQAFDSANKINRFTGAVTDAEIVTKNFRFSPAQRALVTSVQFIGDDAAQIAIAPRTSDADAQTWSAFSSPEQISKCCSVRADGYMHAVWCKMTANFTYAQGMGVKYALRGAR